MHRKVTHWEKPHLGTSGYCEKLWQDGSLTGIIVYINTFSAGHHERLTNRLLTGQVVLSAPLW